MALPARSDPPIPRRPTGRSWRARVHAATGSSRGLLLDGAIDSFIFELGRAVDGPRITPLRTLDPGRWGPPDSAGARSAWSASSISSGR